MAVDSKSVAGKGDKDGEISIANKAPAEAIDAAHEAGREVDGVDYHKTPETKKIEKEQAKLDEDEPVPEGQPDLR
jgi:hypothetical protein